MVEIVNRESILSVEKKISKFDISVQNIPSDQHPYDNQDFFFKNSTSFGVFDGIGGLSRGREAAMISANSVSSELEHLNTNSSRGDVILSFSNGFNVAQRILLDIQQKENVQMGATGTYGFICQESGRYFLEIGHVGDSRAYLFRDNILYTLTQDHNIIHDNFGNTDKSHQIQEYLDNYNGRLSLPPELVVFFNRRNEITRDFGSKTSFVDISTHEISKGDILLFCTDGVSDNLTKIEIQSIITKNKNKGSNEITKNLILESYSRSRENTPRSKPDDMTALTVIINSNPEISSNLPKTISFLTPDGKTDSGWALSRQEKSTGRLVLQKVDEEGVTVITKVSPDQIIE